MLPRSHTQCLHSAVVTTQHPRKYPKPQALLCSWPTQSPPGVTDSVSVSPTGRQPQPASSAFPDALGLPPCPDGFPTPTPACHPPASCQALSPFLSPPQRHRYPHTEDPGHLGDQPSWASSLMGGGGHKGSFAWKRRANCHPAWPHLRGYPPCEILRQRRRNDLIIQHEPKLVVLALPSFFLSFFFFFPESQTVRDPPIVF